MWIQLWKCCREQDVVNRRFCGSLLGNIVRAGQRKDCGSFSGVTGWCGWFFLFSLARRKGPEPGYNVQESKLLLNTRILWGCYSGVLRVCWKTGKLPPLPIKRVSSVLTSRKKILHVLNVVVFRLRAGYWAWMLGLEVPWGTGMCNRDSCCTQEETRPDGRCTQAVAYLPSAMQRKGCWCEAEPLTYGAAIPVWPMPPTELGLAQVAPNG